MQWSTASPNPFPRDATSGLVDGSFTLRKQERVMLNASARLSENRSNSSTGLLFSEDVPCNHIPSLKAKNRNVQTTCVKKLLWISFPIGSANIESDPQGLGPKVSHRC